jgi:hypothetical protein
MHDPQPNPVQPSSAAYKCMSRIAHRMKENHCGPFQAERLNRNLVPMSLE